ncbi:MAG: ferritin [Phycisphaerae bacterium]|jgi:ferritin
MFSQTMLDALNDQINTELRSAYAYLGMSSYCEQEHFRGCARWLRLQSQEELMHAMKLFDFLRDRGGKIVLKMLPEAPVDYKSLQAVFETALQQEIAVSEKINALYELAFKEKAFAAAAQLEWFLTEQIEEEKTARDIVAKFQLIQGDPASLLDLDRELGARGPGEEED